MGSRGLGCCLVLLVAIILWDRPARWFSKVLPDRKQLVAAEPATSNRQAALKPEDSLRLIELPGGTQARLLAHEPQVVDPVEVAFDDAGRLWVVEMRDYPFRTAKEPRGQIVVLSDDDNDGLFEHSHVYADKLEMPTGLALWNQGVVVTVAGQLIYLTDTDGDGRADHRQVWLEGFSQDNEQLRANHPRLGPDGWWYIACGLRGGAVQLGAELQPQTATPPVEIGSRDVRFHLATKTIELVTGPAQFGLTFDALGQRLFCSNRNPASLVVFEQSDLVGNPLAGLASSVVDIVPAGEASRVYPLVDAWVTSHLHSGQFTAACGVFAFGLQDGRTDIFTCEPTGSLVHRQRSVRRSTRWYADDKQDLPEGQEWLASRDAWFRPVNVTVAPDNSIVVVDMHRAVIEHPQWVPEELKQRPDERWGDQAGRILSIAPTASRSNVWNELRTNPLSTRNDGELVKLIAGENLWLRQTAERLLLQRNAYGSASTRGARPPNATINELQQLVDKGNLSANARCAALRLAVLLVAAQSAAETNSPTDNNDKTPVATVNISSSLATDPLLTTQDQSQLAMVALRMNRQQPKVLSVHPDTLINLATHAADAGVRFEAWLCLGSQAVQSKWRAKQTDLEEVARAWTESGDLYELMAAASGLREQPSRLLERWLTMLPSAHELPDVAVSQASLIARSLMAATLRQIEWQRGQSQRGQSATFSDSPQLPPLVKQLEQALAASTTKDETSRPSPGRVAAQLAALECLQTIVHTVDSRELIESSTWEHVTHIADDAELRLDVRTAALRLLVGSPQTDTPDRMEQLLERTTDPSLTAPILQTWCALAGDGPNEVLFDRLASASPMLQRALLPVVAASDTRLAMLADRLETGIFTPGQLGIVELSKLVEQARDETKTRLQRQLSRIANSNRAQVVEQYKPCLSLEPDPLRGSELFRQHCASCHRIGDIGMDVGPNISDSRTKQPLELLTAVLDPNLAIDNNYFRFVVLTEDGRAIEGIITEETAEALIIRGQDDRRELIRREDIATMKATGVSLMPEGLEAQISPQAMADLIGFIKGWRYQDGAIPGQ